MEAGERVVDDCVRRDGLVHPSLRGAPVWSRRQRALRQNPFRFSESDSFVAFVQGGTGQPKPPRAGYVTDTDHHRLRWALEHPNNRTVVAAARRKRLALGKGDLIAAALRRPQPRTGACLPCSACHGEYSFLGVDPPGDAAYPWTLRVAPSGVAMTGVPAAFPKAAGKQEPRKWSLPTCAVSF